MTKNEKGFGAVEIVLVVVIIGLLVTVGWMFFGRQKDSKSNDSEQANATLQDKDTNKTSETPAKVEPATKELTVTPSLGTTGLKLQAPDGWMVTSEGTIGKTINGEEYSIQFILATDSHVGSTYREYAHFVNDYASSNNTILKTVSDAKQYLVKSVSMSDVVLRTCQSLTDTTCYPKHDGSPLIVRLFNNMPNAQSYTGLKDFNSTNTASAISDFSVIAKSVK